jgi:hypothetical protein
VANQKGVMCHHKRKASIPAAKSKAALQRLWNVQSDMSSMFLTMMLGQIKNITDGAHFIKKQTSYIKINNIPIKVYQVKWDGSKSLLWIGSDNIICK